MGDRKVYCDANFDDFRSTGAAMMVVDNHYLSFCYRLDYEDFKEQFNNNNNNNKNDMNVDQDDDEEAAQYRRTTSMLEMPLPDTDTTLIGPNIFNNLRISFNSVNETVPYNFFKYALVNCPNLSFFEVYRLSTPGFKIRAMSQDFGPRRKEMDPSTSTQDNIKVIKLLDGIALDQGLLDLISAHLPNVQELVCQGEQWDRHFW